MLTNDYNITVKYIKEFLEQRNITIKKFFLFGSRARGDYREDSDYDFLIVIENEMTFVQKMKLKSELFNYLSKKNALIIMDLIIKDTDDYEWESNNFGFLSYTVKEEGVAV